VGNLTELFNCSNFIQVKQIAPGKIEIHYSADSVSIDKAVELFDKNNINMDISFVKEKEPVRTVSGKINMLIT
jgi:hypothetical protein